MEPVIVAHCWYGIDPKDGSMLVNCYARLPGLGEVVIGSGRDEFRAQREAAKFLDTNYPGEHVQWIGGYHGGDTESGLPASGYWPD